MRKEGYVKILSTGSIELDKSQLRPASLPLCCVLEDTASTAMLRACPQMLNTRPEFPV